VKSDVSPVSNRNFIITHEGDMKIFTIEKDITVQYLNGKLVTTQKSNNTIDVDNFNFYAITDTANLKHLFVSDIIHYVKGVKNVKNLSLFSNQSSCIITRKWVFEFSTDKNDTLINFPFLDDQEKAIVFADGINKTFFGTIGGGFYELSHRNYQIKHYEESMGLTSTSVSHLFIGKDGTLYVSTLGGGINILKKRPRNYFTLKQSPLRYLQKSNNYYYGIANGFLLQFDKSKIINEVFLRKDVLSFYLSNDTLMVGSFDGLHYYRWVNNKAILLKTFPLTAGISTILPYNGGWLCSTYGGNFYTTKDLVNSVRYDQIPFSNIEKTIPLQNGFAALSYENGFFTCDNNLANAKSYTTKNGLLSNFITDVLLCKDTLWVGGKNGLSLIAHNKVVKTISYKEGFKGKLVRHIFALNNELVYVVSDSYIHIYLDGKLKAIGGYLLMADKNDKMVSVYFDQNNQHLIAATNKNLSIINVFNLLPNDEVATTTLSEIKVDNKNIELNKSFEISYSKNNVSFRFKPLTNLLFNTTELYYKLNNNDWQLVSDSLIVKFTKLRYGSYTLYAKTINADGFESEPFIVAEFIVKKPWWLQTWFIILCIIASLLFIYQLLQYFNKRKYQKKLQELKLQQELESERQRISRDLHDNMGAYTSALIANVQQLKNKTGETEEVEKMQTNADSILASLRETIWVLNSKELSVEQLNDNFKNYCFKLLKNFEHISFNATETIENNMTLKAATVFHITKICQEAIQNIIKHSGATQINYTIAANQKLTITIIDNGCGFNEKEITKGNGLENMVWRAKEAGCKIKISSDTEKGTTLYLEMEKLS
jgi:signal transduction histidine kinase